MMMRFTVPVAIYETQVCVIITDDLQVTADKLSRKYNNPKFDTTTYDAFTFFCGYCYIVLEPTTPDHIVVHECVHATTFILTDRGVIHSQENDEPHAYLTEFLYREIAKKLHEKKKKKRIKTI